MRKKLPETTSGRNLEPLLGVRYTVHHYTSSIWQTARTQCDEIMCMVNKSPNDYSSSSYSIHWSTDDAFAHAVFSLFRLKPGVIPLCAVENKKIKLSHRLKQPLGECVIEVAMVWLQWESDLILTAGRNLNYKSVVQTGRCRNVTQKRRRPEAFIIATHSGIIIVQLWYSAPGAGRGRLRSLLNCPVVVLGLWATTLIT